MADGDGRSAAMALRARPALWIAAAAVTGLCLRLAFGLLYWTGQPLTRDESEYLSLARSLAGGAGFVYDPVVRDGPVQPFGRAPGYPAFLALVGGGHAVVSTVPTSVKVAQSVVGAIGVVLIGMVAGRLGGAIAARRAAWIAAGYPPLVWISGYALSEALFWPLGLLIALCLDGVVTTKTRSVFTGALMAGGMLVRGALVALLPLVAVWLLWRRRPVAALGVLVGVLVVLVPWSIRNYYHHERLVLIASEGGVTFWTGNHPLARGDGDLAANPDLKRAQQALRARHPDLTEEQMEPVYYREAFTWIRQHPLDWLALETRKLFYLVVPVGPSYTLHSTRYFVASVLSYGVLAPFALVGFVSLREQRWRATGLWLLALSSIVVSLAFFPQERFRLPILDPTLIVCASCAWLTKPEAFRE